MKKHQLLKLALLVVLSLTTSVMYAGGGWATSVVSVTLDNGSAYNYKLNDEGWTDGNWGSNSAFQGHSFGIPASLVLNGGSGDGWTDDSPGYNSTSFKLYYRVYVTGSTPGSWNTLNLDFLAFSSGNNKIWDKSNANVDILGLVNNQAGSYTLEVAMSKNQFYNGGNWNSMIPSGQGTAYNSANAGYTATFQILATDINKNINESRVYSSNGYLNINCPANSSIEVFTPNGQSVLKTVASTKFAKSFAKGVYIVKVNGKATKVAIF